MFIEVVELIGLQYNIAKAQKITSKMTIVSYCYMQILTWTWWRRIGSTGMIIIRRWCGSFCCRLHWNTE